MVRKNLIANYLGQGWTAIMGLAFLPSYIHYLGMEAYGLIGLFAVIQAWLTLLDMGMTPTLSREMARFTAGAHSLQSIHDLLRSLEVIAVCIAAVIIASICFVSGYLATDWLKLEKLSVSTAVPALSIMGLVVALRFVESIYRGALLGLQRQVWYNVVSAALATLRFGGAVIVLALISTDVQIFFVWQAAISLLTVVMLAAGVHHALPRPLSTPKVTFSAIAEVWKFASGMMMVTFLAILLTQLDKVLLSRLLTLESFGYYMLAASIAGVLYMVVAPITSAFYPRMVELATRGDKSGLIPLYHLGAQLVTVLVAPIVILLIYFSGDILFMWSGSASLVENAAPILMVFAFGAFLNGLMHMPAQLQLAYGWVGLGIKTNVVAVIVLIPAIFWAVPRYGAIGAAWIWVILNLGYIFISIHLMHQRLFPDEKWRWYLADTLLPVSGSIGVISLASQFQPESYQGRWSSFFFLLITVGLALVVSAALADQVRPRLLAYMKSRFAHLEI